MAAVGFLGFAGVLGTKLKPMLWGQIPHQLTVIYPPRIPPVLFTHHRAILATDHSNEI